MSAQKNAGIGGSRGLGQAARGAKVNTRQSGWPDLIPGTDRLAL
jgi:hypothetical protein